MESTTDIFGIKENNMNIITVPNLFFYQFECNDNLTDKILNNVKNLSWIHNNSNLGTYSDNFFDEELISWFEQCIDQAKTKIGLGEDIKLPITICWPNKTTKLQAHHYHKHPNSFLSGIFYLTSHSDSPTVFTFPNAWITEFSGVNFENTIKNNYFKIYPKKSTLILFPSNVHHSVYGHKERETRYTISFNTFFSGSIYKDPFTKQRLQLSVKTLRDLVNET